jgi:hypothetical protein
MRILTGIVVGLVLCAGASAAEARRGIAIINTGEDVAHVSDLKDEVRAEVEGQTAPGVAIGLIYSRFGVFWLDVLRWDARYVLFQGDQVWQVPEAELQQMAAGPLSKPITYRLPPGLIVLALAAVALGIWVLVRRRNAAAEAHGQPGGAVPDDTPATDSTP